MKRKQIINIDFYEALRMIRKASKPFSVRHVECSLDKNEGGKLNWIEQVTLGPNKKNQYSDILIGFQNTEGGIRQIYIHSIVEVIFSTGEHYRLKLNFQ